MRSPGSIRRGAALLAAIAVDGLVVCALLAAFDVSKFSNVPAERLALVTIINQTPPPSSDWKPPALKAEPLRPAPLTLAMPDLAITFSPELPPVKSLMPQSAAAGGSPAASSVLGKDATTGGNGAARPVVLHRVEPDTSSVPAYEQRDVWVRVLVDTHGSVNTVVVARSSGFKDLDELVVRALRQWVFEPPAEPTWVTERYAIWTGVPPSVFQGRLTLLEFDSMIAQEIRSTVNAVSVAAGREAASSEIVRSVIGRIQAFYETQSLAHNPAQDGLQLPYALLGSWGKIQSVQFLGTASRGLLIDTDNSASRQLVNMPEGPNSGSQWQLYAVRQERGTFIWLLAVTRAQGIAALEGIACRAVCMGPDLRIYDVQGGNER